MIQMGEELTAPVPEDNTVHMRPKPQGREQILDVLEMLKEQLELYGHSWTPGDLELYERAIRRLTG